MSVEIGSYLKQAREKLGLTLEEVQRLTKIQKSFLIAIEKGEFQKLPSPFYVRTYLRSYANCVNVEPHHILRQYRKEEQAERGLTGSHKVLSQTDTYKAHSLINKVDQTNRVTTTMALTIAQPRESNNKFSQEQKTKNEINRRRLGYQGTGGASSSDLMTMNTTPMSLISTKSPSVRVGSSEDEVSTWRMPGEQYLSVADKQISLRQTITNNSGSFPTLSENKSLSRVNRSEMKNRRGSKRRVSFLVRWLFLCCIVGTAIFTVYKYFL